MKHTFILLLLFVQAINSNAQFKHFHYGIIGGPSSTWLLNDNVSMMGSAAKYKSTIGGGIGFFISHNINEKISILLDFIYSKHNLNYTGNGNYNSYPFLPWSFIAEMKMSYFDFPLLLHYGKNNGFYFEIGPQFSYLFDAREDYIETTVLGTFQQEENIECKNDFNKLNIAADIGFVYNVSLGHFLSIGFGPRFGYGFTDVTTVFHQNNSISKSETTEHYANINYFGYSSQYPSYSATHRVFGSFLVRITMEII